MVKNYSENLFLQEIDILKNNGARMPTSVDDINTVPIDNITVTHFKSDSR
jgi:hypothetical protein